MYHRAPINEYFKAELRVDKGKAELRMPVRREFFHAAEGVHGSVYFKALDDTAFFAANSLVDDMFLYTVSFNLYLTRPISEGEMRATGRVVHSSRRLYIAESELTDADGRQIARGSGTFLRSRIPLNPAVGYE